MIKWLVRILFLLITLAITFVLLIDTVARELAESFLSKSLNTEVSIGNIDVSLTSPRIRIENLVIYNPARFGGSKFIEIPDAYFEYNFHQALKGNVFIDILRVNCSFVNNVYDNSNQFNTETIFQNIGKTNSFFPSDIYVYVKTLNISIGTVRWTYLTTPVITQELNVDIKNCIVNNISSKEFNSKYFNNLLVQILLQSGKIGIKDGKLIILNNQIFSK
ncbi:MAG TPA: hypothetical protein PLW02_08825 [Verrucomicrobiota bacterium]|nr:hypothetical protein [Verrucomicrobiota bacterium]